MFSSFEIRDLFLNFFKNRGHKIIPSSSLLPDGDNSILFTTAGMLQFKKMFTKEVNLEYTRASSCQKCLRANDLENIGKTIRHHSFFEMLGNFSFDNDYFKKEAIYWAWEFSTEVIKLNPNKIHISIYYEDDESYKIWKNDIGINEKKIVRLDKDNFWGPAGSEGPCGPCSELYYDLGEEMLKEGDDNSVGGNNDRYLEYWNLVFNEFNQLSNGKKVKLSSRGIDTGMGLERLALIVQGVKSVYETDIFSPIINSMKEITKKPYENQYKSFYNIIADHVRAVSFALAENIFPSNEGRAYVIRKILRRASMAGKKLGIDSPFLYEIIPVVIDNFASVYPELTHSRLKSLLVDDIDDVKNIDNGNKIDIIKGEEKQFQKTLVAGESYLNKLISDKNHNFFFGSPSKFNHNNDRLWFIENNKNEKPLYEATKFNSGLNIPNRYEKNIRSLAVYEKGIYYLDKYNIIDCCDGGPGVFANLGDLDFYNSVNGKSKLNENIRLIDVAEDLCRLCDGDKKAVGKLFRFCKKDNECGEDFDREGSNSNKGKKEKLSELISYGNEVLEDSQYGVLARGDDSFQVMAFVYMGYGYFLKALVRAIFIKIDRFLKNLSKGLYDSNSHNDDEKNIYEYMSLFLDKINRIKFVYEKRNLNILEKACNFLNVLEVDDKGRVEKLDKLFGELNSLFLFDAERFDDLNDSGKSFDYYEDEGLINKFVNDTLFFIKNVLDIWKANIDRYFIDNIIDLVPDYKFESLYNLVNVELNFERSIFCEECKSNSCSCFYNRENNTINIGKWLNQKIGIVSRIFKNIEFVVKSLTKQIRNSIIISGEESFKLYDSIGLPFELTKQIAEEHLCVIIDNVSFNKLLDNQKNTSKNKQARQIETENKIKLTEYVGDTENSCEATILDIIRYEEYNYYNKDARKHKKYLKQAKENEIYIIQTDKTPCYAESGGQIGDIATIEKKNTQNNNILKLKIIDTQRYIYKINRKDRSENKNYSFSKQIGHIVIINGKDIDNLNIKDKISIKIDQNLKKEISANHSATHLLNYYIEKFLGNHIRQEGSFVSESRLRFDFSHFKAVSSKELFNIEKKVNEMIRENHKSIIVIEQREDAIKKGAKAFFSEKYSNKVRTVKIGQSYELCGGSHINYSGEIGCFKIISESSTSQGIRRIEAITGKKAIKMYNEMYNEIKKIENNFHIQYNKINNYIEKLQKENKKIKKEIEQVKTKINNINIDSYIKNNLYTINKSINYIGIYLTNRETKEIKEINKLLKSKIKINLINIIISENISEIIYLITVNKNIIETNKDLNAKKLINIILSKLNSSKGGGNEFMSQGKSKKDKDNKIKVKQIIKQIKEYIEQNKL